MTTRVNKLKGKLDELGIDAFLVTSGCNRRYLSGFSGQSGMLVITKKECFLFTDFRYYERAKEEAVDVDVLLFPNGRTNGKPVNRLDFIAGKIKDLNLKTVGFEGDDVTYTFYEELLSSMSSLELKPVKKIIETIREIKTSDEIDFIKKASMIADEAFNRTMEHVKPGIRECDIRAHMNYYIQILGGFQESFDIIVASGARSAVPHAMTSEKAIQEGELVVIDYGASYKGYCSDCTRTIVLGEPDERQIYVYNLVEKAQKAALDIIRPGVECREVDKAVRDVFAKEGFNEEFGHSTGHGVGLVIHEGPSVSSQSNQILSPGMVITVEPGLYFKDWGGVRIEDMAVIGENNFEIITSVPHGLKKIF